MKRNMIYLLVALLSLFTYNETIAQQMKGTFIYSNDSLIDAFACAEIDSISYKEDSGITNQIIWTSDSINAIPVSVIDSIGFEVPKNIIMQIPEEDLNGWDIGYSLGNEYVVAYRDTTDSTLVAMINKNGGADEAGLILRYDVDGNIVKVGDINQLFDVNYVDNYIILSRINEDGFFEEEIIPTDSESSSSARKQAKNVISFDDFNFFFENTLIFLDKTQLSKSLKDELKKWEWKLMAKDGKISIGLFTKKRNPLKGTTFVVGKMKVVISINQQDERDRNSLFKDCAIEIDEIKPENSGCLVYAKVKNIESLYDYIVKIDDDTKNEETRNLVSCGIVVRIGDENVTTHLNDYKSQEKELNGDVRYDSNVSFEFRFPNLDLTNSFSTFYFRPYLISSRIKNSKGSVDEGRIKYGETVSYKAFSGKILEFKQVNSSYDSNSNSSAVTFKTKVRATIYNLDNVEEWGVYVQKNNNGAQDLHPADITKSEDWIDIEFDINKNEFDDIDNNTFLATKKIKLGVYQKLNNKTEGDDDLKNHYSEPQNYNLVYSGHPSVVTLDVVSTEMTSAVVACRYIECYFWGIVCGIEYTSRDTEESVMVYPQDDNEMNVQLIDLLPTTEYTYRAFYMRNSDLIYGAYKRFSTNEPPMAGIWDCVIYRDNDVENSVFNFTNDCKVTQSGSSFTPSTEEGHWTADPDCKFGIHFGWGSGNYNPVYFGEDFTGYLDDIYYPTRFEGTVYRERAGLNVHSYTCSFVMIRRTNE